MVYQWREVPDDQLLDELLKSVTQDEALRQLACIPQLQTVVIRRSYQKHTIVTYANIEQVRHYAPIIEMMTVIDADVIDNYFRDIHFPSLRRLRLVNLRRCPQYLNIPALEELEINACRILIHELPIGSTHWLLDSAFTNSLRTLRIKDQGGVQDTDLVRIFSTCHRLRVLDLTGSGNMLRNGLIEVAERLTALESLQVTVAEDTYSAAPPTGHLSTETLDALSRNCRNLRHISMPNQIFLSMSPIIRSCRAMLASFPQIQSYDFRVGFGRP